MELSKYKACICEGSAENAIMDILLDNDLLIFTREELLEEKVIRCRDGKRFEERHLRKLPEDKVSVIRILDSRRENFKISRAYQYLVDVINVITAPEIEMLIIFNEDKYREFKKSGKKPSEFCREKLKMADVKSYGFVKTYFSDPAVLVAAIKKYHEMSKIRNGEYTLPEDLSPEERAKEFIRQVKNPYCFRVGDMVVKIVYNEGGPTFQECFEQYLRTTLRYREVMPGNRG